MVLPVMEPTKGSAAMSIANVTDEPDSCPSIIWPLPPVNSPVPQYGNSSQFH